MFLAITALYSYVQTRIDREEGATATASVTPDVTECLEGLRWQVELRHHPATHT